MQFQVGFHLQNDLQIFLKILCFPIGLVKCKKWVYSERDSQE